jgi:Tfp pilus assembly protein PilW
MSRTRAGFSLLESLIAMFIMTLMIVAILSLYSKGQQIFINENALADAIEESRFPLTWITRDVKTATAIEASWGAYTTSDTTLVLRIPSVDANGLIIDLATHWDRVIYLVANSRLVRILDAKDGVSARLDRTKILADGVASLALTYYDSAGAVLTSGFPSASSVKPILTARRQGAQRSFTESLDTKAKMRNK